MITRADQALLDALERANRAKARLREVEAENERLVNLLETNTIRRLEARLREAEEALRAADTLADTYGRCWAKDAKFYAYQDARHSEEKP